MDDKEFDYLIVGAGLFGATFAYLARKNGHKCLVIDRRPHTGGNIHCDNVCGINVHTYGAHIFHTSDREVWRFVNRLVPFNRFTNSPIAVAADGKMYNLPFNMNTFSQLWGVRKPDEARAIIEEQCREAVERMKAEGITEPRNLEEQALSLVGRDIYELLIREYTEKQWGRPCSQMPPFILRRLPVRMTYDNNYFFDSYQGIPFGGYNRLTDALLEGVEVRTGADFFDSPDEWRAKARTTVFTGAIDEFYGYRFGRLEYRTVRFETSVLDTPNFQGNAVMNFPSKAVPYTRIIEHKHFEMFGDQVYDNPRTVISKEFSTEWCEGKEPFYPVNDARNAALYARYKELADAEPDVIFGGRLAEYRYYDMAPVIRKALDLWK